MSVFQTHFPQHRFEAWLSPEVAEERSNFEIEHTVVPFFAGFLLPAQSLFRLTKSHIDSCDLDRGRVFASFRVEGLLRHLFPVTSLSFDFKRVLECAQIF